ncbi:hypothetical protein HYPSUDRAFT_208941 [Hypholoma sublateritium FD-334 SS-4]|uniref:Uncharacterized protein n=1 Tax=Hypholoma sublateritium (strain FD-334 SS-4) TaxID=945553 RepID=A0A0D2NCC9_HYPSF|nr:hypothetical protein HYPSUDRAFT_208941 [Hypholoma sublateritium FD-334 SS-4]
MTVEIFCIPSRRAQTSAAHWHYSTQHLTPRCRGLYQFQRRHLAVLIRTTFTANKFHEGAAVFRIWLIRIIMVYNDTFTTSPQYQAGAQINICPGIPTLSEFLYILDTTRRRAPHGMTRMAAPSLVSRGPKHTHANHSHLSASPVIPADWLMSQPASTFAWNTATDWDFDAASTISNITDHSDFVRISV